MISFRNLGRLGRFGNQLFQYAATRLYGELNGFSCAFPRWDGEGIFGLPPAHSPLRAILPTVQMDDLQATSWPERLLTPVGLWRRGSMAELWRAPRDNLNLHGYLQDDATLDMLRGHRDIIRGWLTFRPEIDAAMRAAAGTGPWVAVHVRRGDMIKRGAGTETAEPLEIARRIAGGRRVFVASDDPAVAGDFAELNPFSVASGLAPLVSDFWMMANAAALIGSGSTFAWWAAFLGTGDYWAPPLNRTWKGTRPPIEQRTP